MVRRDSPVLFTGFLFVESLVVPIMLGQIYKKLSYPLRPFTSPSVTLVNLPLRRSPLTVCRADYDPPPFHLPSRLLGPSLLPPHFGDSTLVFTGFITWTSNFTLPSPSSPLTLPPDPRIPWTHTILVLPRNISNICFPAVPFNILTTTHRPFLLLLERENFSFSLCLHKTSDPSDLSARLRQSSCPTRLRPGLSEVGRSP